MRKTLILEKIDNGYNKLSKDSDNILYPLYLFICYGPFPDSYVEFLEDSSRTEFYGNVANLQKNADKVAIEIYEFLMPGIPPYTITQKNLLRILKEYEKFKSLGFNRIEILFEDGNVRVTGNIDH